MNPLDRRSFVVAGVAACACAACPALRALGAAGAEKPSPLDVGPLKEFRAGGIHGPLGNGRRFFLINRGGRLYAVSATCTHKRVYLVAKGGRFKCPRHGSTFTAEGNVTKSPARKPLPRYAIRVNEQGRVVVDAARVFADQGTWDDADAFVSLD